MTMTMELSNRPDAARINGEHLSKGVDADLRIRPNESYVVLSELQLVRASALRHIIHILLLRAQVQMLWIHAQRIVAGMKHAKAIWDFAAMKLPRHTTGGEFLAANLDTAARPLSRSGRAQYCTSPNPTSIRRLFYSAFKALTRENFCAFPDLRTSNAKRDTKWIAIFAPTLIVRWAEAMRFMKVWTPINDAGLYGASP